MDPNGVDRHLQLEQQNPQQSNGNGERNGQTGVRRGQDRNCRTVNTGNTDIGWHGSTSGNPANVRQIDRCAGQKASKRVTQNETDNGTIDQWVAERPGNGAPYTTARQVCRNCQKERTKYEHNTPSLSYVLTT